MSYMLGVHPGDADCWSDAVHQQLQSAIADHVPVAIGEIGLDFYRGETNAEQQDWAFNAQLDLAVDAGLPVAIHMRDAESQMLDALTNRDRLPTLLFHSYDGSSELTDWVIAEGAYVGVGGLATRAKSTELRKQLQRVSLDRIVLETDAPYLVPNGFKHRRNTPESIPVTAAALADALGESPGEVARRTTANAERLFERLPSP
jgi:TatD DNase family protein